MFSLQLPQTTPGDWQPYYSQGRIYGGQSCPTCSLSPPPCPPPPRLQPHAPQHGSAAAGETAGGGEQWRWGAAGDMLGQRQGGHGEQPWRCTWSQAGRPQRVGRSSGGQRRLGGQWAGWRQVGGCSDWRQVAEPPARSLPGWPSRLAQGTRCCVGVPGGWGTCLMPNQPPCLPRRGTASGVPWPVSPQVHGGVRWASSGAARKGCTASRGSWGEQRQAEVGGGAGNQEASHLLFVLTTGHSS